MALAGLASTATAALTITVRFPASRSSAPLDGRLLLLLSNDPKDEPRMQIDDTAKSQMMFTLSCRLDRGHFSSIIFQV